MACPPSGIGGSGYDSSPTLATEHTVSELCVPSERCMGMVAILADPISGGSFTSKCVSVVTLDLSVTSFNSAHHRQLSPLSHKMWIHPFRCVVLLPLSMPPRCISMSQRCHVTCPIRLEKMDTICSAADDCTYFSCPMSSSSRRCVLVTMSMDTTFVAFQGEGKFLRSCARITSGIRWPESNTKNSSRHTHTLASFDSSRQLEYHTSMSQRKCRTHVPTTNLRTSWNVDSN